MSDPCTPRSQRQPEPAADPLFTLPPPPDAAPHSLGPARLPTVGEAVNLKAQARRKRALAPIMREKWGDPTGARFEIAEADAMDARADMALDPASHAYAVPVQGNGGELVIDSADAKRQPWIKDTLAASPDMLNADASAARMELATAAGALTMALDMARASTPRTAWSVPWPTRWRRCTTWG